MAKRRQDSANGAAECGTIGTYAVRPRMGFECYLNPEGDIVVRQECRDDEERYVLLSSREASRLVEALQALIPGASD
jgi:hypothetical protein